MNTTYLRKARAMFTNQFASEALPGALPVGRNSPQRCAYGLYAEQISGSAFTAPRSHNRRTWMYRLRPGAVHEPFEPLAHPGIVSDFSQAITPPNQLRWSPLPLPTAPTDFLPIARCVIASSATAMANC